MSQTPLDYNSLMFGKNGQPFRYKSATITGAADLSAGTILVPDGTGKYRAAVDADKVPAGAGAIDAGWRILLEAAAVTGGDVSAKTGVSGGVFKDKLVGVGLVIDDLVYGKLEANNIFAQAGTDAIQIAGEDA